MAVTTRTEAREAAGWPHMREHAERGALLGELHARPFEPMATPRRIYHFAFLVGDAEARADRQAIAELSARQGSAPPAAEARYHRLDLPGWRLRWQRHTEFVTYTWDTGRDAERPFARAHPGDMAAEFALRQPGELLVAAHMAVVAQRRKPIDAAAWFDAGSLSLLAADGGRARAVSDFKVDAHGFTRFLVVNRELGEAALGVFTQLVLEIETYRTLALLGLPEARRAAPLLRQIESSLADLTRAIGTDGDVATNRRLLASLIDLAARLETQSAETSYRFGASRAYYDLVQDRLEAVGPQPAEGERTFAAFFDRRLRPAINTCKAVDERQALLSPKLMRTADLLRTRLQFALEEQNRDLLQSMNRRARLQLRLQQTVEGLSVAAISYYVVGLVYYLVRGGEEAGLPMPWSPTFLAGAAVPVVVLGVWLLVRRARRRFLHEGGGGGG